MNMRQAIDSVLSKYATFTGRAGRPEFWWWVLALLIAFIVAAVLDRLIFRAMFGWQNAEPLTVLLWLAVLLPNLAVAARRLHDTDRSAWWLLLYLVPVIGGLVLLYFYLLRGTEGANRFG